MNVPKRLRKLALFQLYECGAMKDYLEEMALKGWKLTSFSRLFFYFEQIEPQILIYSVEIFSKASINDSVPASHTSEYIEYCRAAGWDFVYNSGQFVVFVATSENATPIETEEDARLKAITKAIIKQNAGTIVLTPIWIVLAVMEYMMNANLSLDISSLLLLTNISILEAVIFFIWLFLFAGTLCQVSIFLIWAAKQKHRLSENKPLQFISLKKHYQLMAIRLMPIVVVALALLIIIKPEEGGWYIVAFVVGPILLLAIALFLFSHFLSKAGLNRRINIIISVAGGIAIVIAVIIVSIGALFAAMTDREYSSNVDKYDTLLVENYYGNVANTYRIFPDSIPEGTIPEDFYYEYYNPWDACFLIYLNLEFDAGSLEKETARLGEIVSNEDINYGTTGFRHTLLATRSSTEGIVYAIADEEEKRIVYVLIQFYNYFTDINYTKHIPEEYLPIGFNALPGNDMRKAFDEIADMELAPQ